MLKIYSRKIKSKITNAVYSETVYYYIWGLLPNDTFKTINISRGEDGTFNI